MATIINGGGSIDSYSTGEQVVGTWIDGSTIYRKCFTFTLNGNNTESNIAHGLSSAPKIISYGGYFIPSNYPEKKFVFPCTHKDSGGICGILSCDATNLHVLIGSYYGTCTGAFYIDYIKE